MGMTDFMGPRIDRIRLLDDMQDDDGGGPFGSIGEKPRLLEPAAEEALRQRFEAERWTDHLPIVLPTEERVAAMLRGTSRRPDEVVVVGAHLDSWDLGQGALDNGANVAMLIDIARQMTRLGLHPARTIRFVLWNGEEQGMIGSWRYTEQHAAELDRTAIETADTPEPGCYTWRDLERGSAMLANVFVSLSLPAGARVAVQVDKSVEALMLYLAVQRAGLVYLPLNTAYQQAEIEYFIGDAEPALVVCAPKDFTWISRLAFQRGTKNVFTLGDDRTGSLLERAAWMSDQHTPVMRSSDDLAAILYTSGTTGRSKGAMLTHGNLVSNARVLKDHWGWQPGDVLIHALPIFHVHGLFVASHGALLNGSKMIWFSRFDAQAAIARFAEATVFMGVPTLYTRLLGEPALTRDACVHMRLFISGSAPLQVETFDAWAQRSGTFARAVAAGSPHDQLRQTMRAALRARPFRAVLELAHEQRQGGFQGLRVDAQCERWPRARCRFQGEAGALRERLEQRAARRLDGIDAHHAVRDGELPLAGPQARLRGGGRSRRRLGRRLLCLGR